MDEGARGACRLVREDRRLRARGASSTAPTASRLGEGTAAELATRNLEGAVGPFDRFNDRAKRVLALSQDEAIRFNHNYIGTEHLLLGLVREGEGVAARVLDSLHVDLSALRRAVELTIGRGDSTKTPSEITLAPEVKKVID